MAIRRRHYIRRRVWDSADTPITIRISDRRSACKYREMQVTGPEDAGRFGTHKALKEAYRAIDVDANNCRDSARLVDDQVQVCPQDPLIMSINNHQPWLNDLLSSCFKDYWDQISELNREMQFASTAQFPEKSPKHGTSSPWTFIIDEMNVPQVYHWSVGLEAPEPSHDVCFIERYRMRLGVWFCGKGACRFNRNVSTTLIFTRPTPLSEHIVSNLLFEYLHKEDDWNQPREDEKGVCWIFSRLHWLLTDWQNIIREIMARLDESELNSRSERFPVKLRTRTMHKEVDRIYELKEYLRFHLRSFRKLLKLKDVSAEAQKDDLWVEIDDIVDDLDQFDSTLDSLKERFNNLLDLEFNIQNADQSDDSAFLLVIATLFIPMDFLGSLWGITTITWAVEWFVYIAAPTFVISVLLLVFWPPAARRYQQRKYGLESTRIMLQPKDFTMLGNELPDGADIGGGNRLGRSSARSQKRDIEEAMVRSRSRSRSEHPMSRTEEHGRY